MPRRKKDGKKEEKPTKATPKKAKPPVKKKDATPSSLDVATVASTTDATAKTGKPGSRIAYKEMSTRQVGTESSTDSADSSDDTGKFFHSISLCK